MAYINGKDVLFGATITEGSGGGSKFRRIAKIVLEQEQAVINIDKDDSGYAFNIGDAFLFISAVGTSTNNTGYAVQVYANSEDKIVGFFPTTAKIISNAGNYEGAVEFRYYGNTVITRSSYRTKYNGLTADNHLFTEGNYKVINEIDGIKSLKILEANGGGEVFGIGTTFELWGVDALREEPDTEMSMSDSGAATETETETAATETTDADV